jgi:hypothetical protein
MRLGEMVAAGRKPSNSTRDYVIVRLDANLPGVVFFAGNDAAMVLGYY